MFGGGITMTKGFLFLSTLAAKSLASCHLLTSFSSTSCGSYALGNMVFFLRFVNLRDVTSRVTYIYFSNLPVSCAVRWQSAANYATIYIMEEKKSRVIEAEVLDENGLPVAQDIPRERVRVYQARAGFLTGFFALAFSFIMILVTAVVTVFIVLPLLLLGRVLGMQVKTFKR